MPKNISVPQIELSAAVSAVASAMTPRLLAWYEKNKRALPWRENITPYAIWVSEIMAQQTRIAQLVPFYERFMARFPTVETLAAASQDEVLQVWAGMGYYARARNLHAAAGLIVSMGHWPETAGDWRKLPGVGAYTAGAVMSIAFGARETAVDGNALRVYARLAEDETDIQTPLAGQLAGTFLQQAIPEAPSDISRFTQAVMELGALVCVPGQPLCGVCPLESLCLSRRAGREKMLPRKTPKKAAEVIDLTVLLILDPEGRVLMRQRTEKLLQGLWVFYLLEQSLTPDEACAYLCELGYTLRALEPIGRADHVFTHRVWRMNGYAAFVHERFTPDDYVFLPKETLQNAALPKATAFYTRWYLSQ